MSSIPAISNTAPTARVTASAPAGERAPSHVPDRAQPRSAPRHELVDAMMKTLAVDSSEDRRGHQAIARFAHALIHDLRRIGGDDEQAFGRREWSALGPRIDALASAAAAQAAAAAQDVPREPSPLTAVTAALHVMQVPSSRLVEAFRVLHEAVPSLAEVVNGAADTRSQLAAFLQRMAPAAPHAPEPGAGALLNATA